MSFNTQFKLQRKFDFALICILKKWLLQNFAHDMTAELSCHVQKIVVIESPGIELWKTIFLIDQYWEWKVISDMLT